jgi:hypothetical protein
MIKNFDTFPISPQNSFTFNKNTFDLSIFNEELHNFYNNVELDNDIYYAHAFNKNGLFYNPYPIKGYQAKKIDYNSLYFNFFSDKDITLATDIENDKYNNYIHSMYKYNILCLYDSILKTLKGYGNGYNPFFDYNNIEKEVEFYLFISKHCINIPEFDILKDEYFKEYKSF